MKNVYREDETMVQALPLCVQWTQKVSEDGMKNQDSKDKNLFLWCDERIVEQKLADFFAE